MSYKSVHIVGLSRKEESSRIFAHHHLGFQISTFSQEVSLPRLTAKLSLYSAIQFFVLFSFLILSSGMLTSHCLAW